MLANFLSTFLVTLGQILPKHVIELVSSKFSERATPTNAEANYAIDRQSSNENVPNWVRKLKTLFVNGEWNYLFMFASEFDIDSLPSPRRERVFDWLGVAAFRTGNLFEANKFFVRGLSFCLCSETRQSLLSNQAALYIKIGNLDKARLLLAKASEIFPGFLPVVYNKLVLATMNEEWSNALNLLAEVCDLDDNFLKEDSVLLTDPDLKSLRSRKIFETTFKKLQASAGKQKKSKVITNSLLPILFFAALAVAANNHSNPILENRVSVVPSDLVTDSSPERIITSGIVEL